MSIEVVMHVVVGIAAWEFSNWVIKKIINKKTNNI